MLTKVMFVRNGPEEYPPSIRVKHYNMQSQKVVEKS